MCSRCASTLPLEGEGRGNEQVRVKRAGERVGETVTSPERTSKEREACTALFHEVQSEAPMKECTKNLDDISRSILLYFKEKIGQRKHTESNRSRSSMSEIRLPLLSGEQEKKENTYMIDAPCGVMLLAPDLGTLE